jgi:hypothetical protein
MGILDELLGGGQRQKEYRDFVDRYERGDPSEATRIKRFSSGMVRCHTPCRPTVRSGGAGGAGQTVAGRTGGVREDAAGASRSARRGAAATSGARTEGTGPGAH